jgi:hypothetical protein
MDWEDQIAIANYGTMAFLMGLGLVACFRAYSEPGLLPDAKRLIVGIALFCGCFGTHQTFWFARWYLFALGDERTNWFLEHSWMLMGPYMLGYTGSIYVAYALFRSRCFVTNRTESMLKWQHGWAIWLVGVASVWLFVFTVLP